LRRIVACCNKYKNNNIKLHYHHHRVGATKKYQNRPPKFTIYVPKLVRHLILQRGRSGGELVDKRTHKKGQKRRKKTIDGSRRQKFVKPNVP
jgi:hypothetical protein